MSDDRTLTGLTRRLVLGAAAASAASLLARPASAATPVIIGQDGWLFPIWDEAGFIDPKIITNVLGVVNTAIDAFHKAKIEVAICLLPAKSRVYADFLPPGHKTSPAIEQRYATALKGLSASGPIIFDQAAFFQACRNVAPGTDLFFKADTHWLPVGAASAAAEMANQIRAKGHLPPSAQPGVTLSQPVTAVQDHNDLAALLPAGDRAKYPDERYLTRDLVADSGAGLLEDDAPDTVVVGNSFMQPAYGYAVSLSSELQRPVGLAWRVHQFSPYWTMLDYLKSPAFTKRRPNLVVWTFHEVDINTPIASKDVWGDTAMTGADFLAALRTILA